MTRGAAQKAYSKTAHRMSYTYVLTPELRYLSSSRLNRSSAATASDVSESPINQPTQTSIINTMSAIVPRCRSILRHHCFDDRVLRHFSGQPTGRRGGRAVGRSDAYVCVAVCSVVCAVATGCTYSCTMYAVVSRVGVACAVRAASSGECVPESVCRW